MTTVALEEFSGCNLTMTGMAASGAYKSLRPSVFKQCLVAFCFVTVLSGKICQTQAFLKLN
jgi:hypothetical protein